MDVDLLKSINERLAKLYVLDILRDDINPLYFSREFSQCQIDDLRKENTARWRWCKRRTNNLKKPCLMYSVDNLIFSGTPENDNRGCEDTVRDFMSTQLKLPTDVVHNVTFSRVHRIGKASGNRPQAIIAWFDEFNQKEMMKSRGRVLRNIDFGMNDHFPTEINENIYIFIPS
jgi:hypothetical protein